MNLLELGHRDIVHISGPADSFSARRRTEAFRHTMGEAGLPVRPVLVGDWSAASGLAIGRELAASAERPTAVFVSNDQMALGVMHAFHERGLHVPGDVSIVGFDDSEEAAAFWPALTTVHQHFDIVGQSATNSLIAMIDGEPAPKNTLVATRLVVRDSTGPGPVPAPAP